MKANLQQVTSASQKFPIGTVICCQMTTPPLVPSPYLVLPCKTDA